MRFKVIASGSKGNMTYIETEKTKILLDCGVSYGNAKLTLALDGIDIDDVELVICTHEHSDHTRELAMILKKTKAALYINEKSYQMLNEKTLDEVNLHPVKFIEANKKYTYQDLSIYTLQMSHDSINCLGFVFQEKNSFLGYATDTGLIHIDYFPILRKCSSLIIEANHNVEMLQESKRQPHLIRRILSVKGHMSNHITCSILESILTENNKNVILAHVSEDCNNDEMLHEEIIDKLKDRFSAKLIIARQREALELMEV